MRNTMMVKEYYVYIYITKIGYKQYNINQLQH